MSIWMLFEIFFACNFIINIIDILYNLIMFFPSQPIHSIRFQDTKLSLLSMRLRYSNYIVTLGILCHKHAVESRGANTTVLEIGKEYRCRACLR